MKILFLDQYAEVGGAQKCLLELLPVVSREGWEAHVALPGDGPLLPLLRTRGVQVHSLPLGNYSQGRKNLLDAVRFFSETGTVAAAIRRLADRIRPAVLYVNGPRLMPAVARAETGTPVVFHTHNCVPARNGKHLVALALRRTGASVIAATKLAACQWECPSRVVYGGVGGPPPGWSPAPRRNGPRIGLVGRIQPEKCQKEFVMAAAQLGADRPEAEFYVCGDTLFGDPRDRAYKEQVLGAAPPSVRFLGWRDDVYSVLANLDLLVMPSLGEGGIPLVVLEAFAAGVPVLASPAGDLGEVIQEGVTGFLLPAPTASSIASRLRDLLPNLAKLREVAGRANSLWRDRFTVERYRNEVWESVLAASCGVPVSDTRPRQEGERSRAF